MLLQPVTDIGHCSLISVEAWMSAMEDPNLPEQHYSDPAALALTDFSPKFNEERLSITPLDIGTDWMRKDGIQGFAVLSSHRQNGTRVCLQIQLSSVYSRV